MLTQKKRNFYIKVAAYSHNNALTVFLYWITGDSSDRCDIQRATDFAWKNSQAPCEVSAPFWTEIGRTRCEHIDI